MLAAIRRMLLPTPAVRSYDGAQGGRRWRGAGEMPAPISAGLTARGPLSRRARYLVANNAMAAAGLEAWTSALVGSGIRPTPTHPDAAFCATAAASFEGWTDRADADGLGDAYALQALAARLLVRDGECFVVMNHADDGALQLRVLDSEMIDPAMNRELGGGARIISGIEFDASGRRIAYHVFKERPGLPLGAGLDTIRLPAEDVCHVFKPETAGQIRGVSWFASVLLRLRDLDDAHDAQIMRQKTAALMTGFIVSADGQVPFDGERDGGTLEGGLEPGTIKVLSPGQDYRQSDPAKIGAEAVDFLRLTAKEVAAGLGVPASAITGDYGDANYSSLRAELVAFRRRVEALQHNVLVYQLCRPIRRRFITSEVLSGRLSAPGFMADPEPYLACRWIVPKQEWTDPAKDVAAEIEAINAGLMSRRQAVEARGISVEELDTERAADAAREAVLGLEKKEAPNGN